MSPNFEPENELIIQNYCSPDSATNFQTMNSELLSYLSNQIDSDEQKKKKPCQTCKKIVKVQILIFERFQESTRNTICWTKTCDLLTTCFHEFTITNFEFSRIFQQKTTTKKSL